MDEQAPRVSTSERSSSHQHENVTVLFVGAFTRAPPAIFHRYCLVMSSIVKDVCRAKQNEKRGRNSMPIDRLIPNTKSTHPYHYWFNSKTKKVVFVR